MDTMFGSRENKTSALRKKSVVINKKTMKILSYLVVIMPSNSAEDMQNRGIESK